MSVKRRAARRQARGGRHGAARPGLRPTQAQPAARRAVSGAGPVVVAGSRAAPTAYADLVDQWLAGRSPRTLAAYAADVADFARFIGAPSAGAAAELLLAAGHGPANALAFGYRTGLHDRGLAAATVNRRVAALRSLVTLARTMGLVPWTLDVPLPSGWSRTTDAAETERPKNNASSRTRPAS